MALNRLSAAVAAEKTEQLNRNRDSSVVVVSPDQIAAAVAAEKAEQLESRRDRDESGDAGDTSAIKTLRI